MKLILLIIGLMLLTGTASAWLSGFDYRTDIQINNTDVNATYHIYNFTVDTAALIGMGKMQANGSDCWITDSNDNLLPMWAKDDAFNKNNTKIEVNATTLGNIINTTHYMYYGKNSAVTQINGSAVFPFFSNFGTNADASITSTEIGTLGKAPTRGIRVADLDGNGDNEVYMANEMTAAGAYGGWFGRSSYNLSTDTWTQETICQGGTDQWYNIGLDIGNADNVSGNIEAYTGDWHPGEPPNRLGSIWQEKWTGSAWTCARIATAAGDEYGVQYPKIGDGDNDGINEVYFADDNTHVYNVSNKTGTWVKTLIATFPDATVCHYDIDVGDGKNNGSNQVYVSGQGAANAGYLYLVEWNGTGWDTSEIVNKTSWIRGVEIGDPDNDGYNDIYVTCCDNHIYGYNWTGSTWSETDLGAMPAVAYNAIDIGDINNDGNDELVVGNDGGHVYEYYWNGTGWELVDLGQYAPVAGATANAGVIQEITIGDGNNDGQNEIYIAYHDDTDDSARWVQIKIIGSNYRTAISSTSFTGDNKWYRVMTGCGGAGVATVINGILKLSVTRSSSYGGEKWGSNSSFTRPYIFEWTEKKIWSFHNEIGDGILMNDTTADDGYYIKHDTPSGDDLSLIRKQSGAETFIANYDWVNDVGYHDYRAVLNATYISVYMDDVLILHGADSTYAKGILQPRVCTYDGTAERWYDDIRIRDYMNIPPTVSLGSEENAPAGASITSWQNNKTSNNSLDFTINTSEAVNFNITVNQSVDNHNWYKDDVDQSHNYDNITLNWSSTGLKHVVVNATNTNGTSSSITWNVTVQVILSAPTNLTATPYTNSIFLDWDDATNADNYSIYRQNESIPYTATAPTLDGIIDAIYNTTAHKYIIYSPNPVTTGDYESIQILRTASDVYVVFSAIDNDDKIADDRSWIYFDFEQDGLTTDDHAWKITNNVVSCVSWDGSAWATVGGSAATGASTGAGSHYPVHELKIPVSELPASFVNGSSVDVLFNRVCTALNPDAYTYFPYGNINNTDTSLWQSMKLTNATDWVHVANSTPSEYTVTGLNQCFWYNFAVTTWNGTQESSKTTVSEITQTTPLYNISGYVFDEVANPILDATVSISDGVVFQRVSSNASGYYKLINIHNGTYTVEASKTEYTSSDISVTVIGIDKFNQNITIQSSPVTTWEEVKEAINWAITMAQYLLSNIGVVIVTAFSLVCILILMMLIGAALSVTKIIYR